MEFKKHKRKGALSELIKVQDYIQSNGNINDVSISAPDLALPKEVFEQGYIARNPNNHDDKWYISKEYYDKNLEPFTEPQPTKQETFYDRLLKERDELSYKLTKLEGFLSNPEKVKQISGETQFELLVEQSVHMTSYLNILDERIIHLETSTSTI